MRMQITTGIRSILSLPLIYNLFQLCLGAKKGREEYVQKYIRPLPHDKILDIGCGTADTLDFLPATVDYFGFDLENKYIEHAKKKFGQRGKFICNDVNNVLPELSQFDIILVTGVLHHLSDNEAIKLFKMASASLKHTGRMITIDGCYIKNQSRFAKFFISKDRGQNIRSPEGYQALAKHYFQELKTDVRHNLLRIPYTHFIMECSRPLVQDEHRKSP